MPPHKFSRKKPSRQEFLAEFLTFKGFSFPGGEMCLSHVKEIPHLALDVRLSVRGKTSLFGGGEFHSRGDAVIIQVLEEGFWGRALRNRPEVKMREYLPYHRLVFYKGHNTHFFSASGTQKRIGAPDFLNPLHPSFSIRL